jgi:hypothetical protein
VNHKDLHAHIVRHKSAVAKALQNAKNVLLPEKEEQERAVRLKKAKKQLRRLNCGGKKR